MELPIVPSVPGAPDVAIVSLRVTRGPQGLSYYEQAEGSTLAYTPKGILLPTTCPRGGFPFAATFSFLDGSHPVAHTTVPCPHSRRRRHSSQLVDECRPSGSSSTVGEPIQVAMSEDGPRNGSLIAALGAPLLAVSVFQPWYALSVTAAGAASAGQAFNKVALQFGNAAFQSEAQGLASRFNTLAGRQVATLSADQALKYVHVVLLILAAAAFVSALSRLAGVSQASDGQIALIGLTATICVVFRMVVKPIAAEEAFSLSLSWGAWLALGSSLAITVGGVLPRHAPSATPSAAALGKTWEGLSGWTPQA
jgi:hypothetical protein